MQKHKRFEIPDDFDLVPNDPEKVGVCILTKRLEQKEDGNYYKTVMSSCTVFDVSSGLQLDDEPMFVSAVTMDPEAKASSDLIGARLRAIYKTLIPDEFYRSFGIQNLIALNQEDRIDAITKLKEKGFGSLVDTMDIWWPGDTEFM
jgi:hypothetical protein